MVRSPENTQKPQTGARMTSAIGSIQKPDSWERTSQSDLHFGSKDSTLHIKTSRKEGISWCTCIREICPWRFPGSWSNKNNLCPDCNWPHCKPSRWSFQAFCFYRFDFVQYDFSFTPDFWAVVGTGHSHAVANFTSVGDATWVTARPVIRMRCRWLCNFERVYLLDLVRES